jgi:proteasome lid subunit RPN8/RPN11
MIFKKPKVRRTVTITKESRDGILTFCKMNHPNEGLLILRGRSQKGNVKIEGLVIPPFSEHGPTFAGFPHSFLPFDPSYVGTVHSHPIGSPEPSITDLHNFFGLVTMIVKSPYEDNDIFAYDRDGNILSLSVE